MAIPTVRVVGAIESDTVGITPGSGLGRQVDDIDIVLIECPVDGVVSLTTANGFQRITALDQGVGSSPTGSQMSVWWRRWDGVAGAPVFADAGDHIIGRSISIAGCITTGDPWDIVGVGTTDTTGDTSLSAAGGTTTVADCLILHMACQGLPDANDVNEFGTPTNADLSDLTERMDNARSPGNGGAIWMATGGKAVAGAFGPTTLTTVTSTPRVCGMLALKPPAAAGTQSLTGSLFTKAPTFFTGVVTSVSNLAGVLFTKAPTFFTGAVTATRALTGVLFTKAPTFPTGAVSLEPSLQTLTGALFTKAPTFPTGTVTATYSLTGVLFQKAPTFPQGAVTAGAVALTGTLFTKAPTFPQGAVTAGGVTVTGVLFTKAPTFPTGVVTAGAVALSGILFQKAPTFPTGTIGQSGTIFGNLFVKAPTFFTGSLAQGGPSFWTPNPAAYVGVTRYGPSPWGAELSGQRFEKAPTFPVGAVS